MALRFARLFALALLLALTPLSRAVLAEAQPPADEQSDTLAQLGRIKPALDQIEATLRRNNLTSKELGDLSGTLDPIRDDLRNRLGTLEKQLADIAARRKELGPPPAPGAPPESATIVTERARLDTLYNDLDAAAKEARLLALRADALANRIAERQRDLVAQRLLQKTSSVLDPFFWLSVGKAIPGELHSVGVVLQSWWSFARDTGGLARIAAALATLAAIVVLASVLGHWWRERFKDRKRRDTRAAKAFRAVGVFVQHALTTPLIVFAAVQIAEAFNLVPERIHGIGRGLIIGVTVAAFGRAVARGALSPDHPEHRVTRFDDVTARILAGHLTWAARALGLAIFLLLLYRAIGAVSVMAVATRMLLAAAIVGLLLSLLFKLRHDDEAAEAGAAPPRLWARGLAWLLVAGIVASLVMGYVGLAYFLAERMLVTVAVVGAFYLLGVASDALLTDMAAAETPRGRAIAANFGLKPRTVGLLGALLAGVVRVLLIIAAIVFLLGPWRSSTASFFDRLRGVTVGFEVGGITISIGTILSAVAVLIVFVVVTRAIQRWLANQLLPRTTLDPSLQLSVVTIFGYLGVIAAITLALGQIGIDLQKVALIAGALSVGIGFGLQSIVSNFVSGLILLAERPIRVGDQINVKGEEGFVRRISVRATEIETFDRASVIVPNSALITEVVKNWTHANLLGRIVIKVGIGYDSDPAKARDILLACALDHPKILQTPAPAVLLASFGDSALNFELYAVIANLADAGGTKSDLHFEILKRFAEAGITIPFPQREVRLLGGEATRPEKGDPAPA